MPRYTLEPSKRDTTAYKRRQRAGRLLPGDGRSSAYALPVEIRNGLPEFKPYIYRGAGHDEFGDDDE